MAEPVGITGTAAGLVSLGLQLYGEISKYIDAVKGRKRDLDFAREQTENLQKCLLALDNVSFPSTTHTSTNEAIAGCLDSCRNELKALDELVVKLRGPEASAGTLSERLKQKARELAYPFHRDDIRELERRLDTSNRVLQTALNSAGV
ncbi:ankyrin repeat-containing protein [Colletotrichum karsti]|uniref:Ankyrin repeat-containing protein n=1 Tax=Colletotrichum karsti TaxID=1095194 RepID=A0A9P6LI29_9PEZI|nr:ankyrin repeat-containing protein [Colletotrichum karsti]KAF9874198.1 ankyrin repeat-containing protein [Colletotrichum karsti]